MLHVMKHPSIFESVIILALLSAIAGSIALGTIATARFVRELQKIRQVTSFQVDINEPVIFRASK